MTMGQALLRTSHLSLRVADLARSQKFYEELFGFVALPADDAGSIAMNIAGEDEPVLLLEASHDARAPKPRVEPEPFIGMEHFAFELAPDDFGALRAFYRHLKDVGAEIHHCVDHIITNSIYFLDPDRNLIEAYVNCPRSRFEAMEHPYGSREDLTPALEGKCEPGWMTETASQ
jgi:catechol 2,3-dioxygenase